MFARRTAARSALAATLLLAACQSECPAFFGSSNMPSTLTQCLGVGFGPGYHRQMVLRPRYRTLTEGKGIVRAHPTMYPPIYDTRGLPPIVGPVYGPTTMQAPLTTRMPPQMSGPITPETSYFAPPAMRAPGMPYPNAEVVMPEPGSPSDALPMPRR